MLWYPAMQPRHWDFCLKNHCFAESGKCGFFVVLGTFLQKKKIEFCHKKYFSKIFLFRKIVLKKYFGNKKSDQISMLFRCHTCDFVPQILSPLLLLSAYDFGSKTLDRQNPVLAPCRLVLLRPERWTLLRLVITLGRQYLVLAPLSSELQAIYCWYFNMSCKSQSVFFIS